jgi:replication-associated recombination protein RarA
MDIKPQTYRDIVYPDAATATLIEAIVKDAGRFPATNVSGVLLYGPPGTGKTTLSRLIVKDMQIERLGRQLQAVNVYKISGGANGVAVLQEITNAASLVPVNDDLHYFVLDEVDNLTSPAMQSLTTVMDMPQCVFIMTTNYFNKIPPRIVSRCWPVHMRPPAPDAWLTKCKEFMIRRGVTKLIEDQALLTLIAACRGDVREIFKQMTLLADAFR